MSHGEMDAVRFESQIWELLVKGNVAGLERYLADHEALAKKSLSVVKVGEYINLQDLMSLHLGGEVLAVAPAVDEKEDEAHAAADGAGDDAKTPEGSVSAKLILLKALLSIKAQAFYRHHAASISQEEATFVLKSANLLISHCHERLLDSEVWRDIRSVAIEYVHDGRGYDELVGKIGISESFRIFASRYRPELYDQLSVDGSEMANIHLIAKDEGGRAIRRFEANVSADLTRWIFRDPYQACPRALVDRLVADTTLWRLKDTASDKRYQLTTAQLAFVSSRLKCVQYARVPVTGDSFSLDHPDRPRPISSYLLDQAFTNALAAAKEADVEAYGELDEESTDAAVVEKVQARLRRCRLRAGLNVLSLPTGGTLEKLVGVDREGCTYLSSFYFEHGLVEPEEETGEPLLAFQAPSRLKVVKKVGNPSEKQQAAARHKFVCGHLSGYTPIWHAKYIWCQYEGAVAQEMLKTACLQGRADIVQALCDYTAVGEGRLPGDRRSVVSVVFNEMQEYMAAQKGGWHGKNKAVSTAVNTLISNVLTLGLLPVSTVVEEEKLGDGGVSVADAGAAVVASPSPSVGATATPVADAVMTPVGQRSVRAVTAGTPLLAESP